MKLKIRIDKVESVHVHFTVFTNGVNCGSLCFLWQDFYSLNLMLKTNPQSHFYELEGAKKLDVPDSTEAK